MRQSLLGIPSEGTALENYERDTHAGQKGSSVGKTGTICGPTIISFLVPRMCTDLLLIAYKLVSVILLTDGISMSLCSSYSPLRGLRLLTP